MNDHPMTDAAILGAGISGLYAALKLARAGRSVVILEQEDHPGGLASSIQAGDNHFELGINLLEGTNPDVLMDVKALLGDQRIEVRPEERIRWGKGYLAYPLSLGDLAKGMPFHKFMGGVAGMMGAKLWRQWFPKPPKNAEQSLQQRYGGAFYQSYFREFTEKHWDTPLNQISPKFIEQKFPRLSALDGMRRMLDEGAGSANGAAPLCHYATTGTHALIQAMLLEIQALGGKLICRAEVTGVTVENNLLQSVTWRETDSDPEEPVFHTMPCQTCVTTIPVRALVKAFGTQAPAQFHASSLHLRYRPTVVYACLVRKEKCLDALTIRFRDRIFHRLSEPKHAGMQMSPGHTILLIETTPEINSQTWHGEEEIWTAIMLDLKAEEICNRDDVVQRHVLRGENAFPVYRKDFEEHRDKVFGYFRRIENLECAGATGLFAYASMDQAMASAADAAQRLLVTMSVRHV